MAFGKKDRAARLLFVTDLHASEVTFRKLMNAVEIYEATALIIGGDLAGKRVVPVIKEAKGYTTSVSGEDIVVDESGLADLLTKVKNLGQYPMVLGVEEYGSLVNDPDAVHRAVPRSLSRPGRRLDGAPRGEVRVQGDPRLHHRRQRRLPHDRGDPRRGALGRQRRREGHRGGTRGGDDLDRLRQPDAVELPA